MVAEVTGDAIASQPNRGPWRLERDGFSHVAVAGTPDEMGAQHGELLRHEIQDMVAALSHHVLNGRGGFFGHLTRAALRSMPRLMEARIHDRYKCEMAALAHAADVPYRDILLLNCLDDILANLRLPGEIFARWACSGFANWGSASATGDLLCGRNLDYYVWSADGEDPWAATSYMKDHVVAITYQPADKPPFVSVGWPGFIGCPTVLNARRFCQRTYRRHPLELAVRNPGDVYLPRYRRVCHNPRQRHRNFAERRSASGKQCATGLRVRAPSRRGRVQPLEASGA